MCGIAVAVDWLGADSVVEKLLSGLAHRGDVTDPVVSPRPNTSMGTRRLRIVDAEHGAQPKLSANGRILVSFNGEIYNHVELRRELEALGVKFRTHCDTEVLANALSLWGPAALPRLEGMFAFVAIDIAAGEFLAARDGFGVKPLYLAQDGHSFLFCSEMRPLLDATEKLQVLLLPPGHLLTRQSLQPFRNWARAAATAPQPNDPARLDALLRKAVHGRTPPDLPFALLFSGGIDSTLVAHYARELRADAPGYFLGDERAPDFEHAQRYAELSGLDLRRVSIQDPRLHTRAHLEAVIGAVESFEPSMVRDALCNYSLFERIHADGFRVALSGEGADELFAGYLPLEVAFAHSRQAGDYVRNQTMANMSRTNLQRLDRCGMRFQVEAREPLLDSDLAAYALALDSEALIDRTSGRTVGKAPLRAIWDLYPGKLPDSIRTRRKVAMHVGSGLDRSQTVSPWIDFAEQTVPDAEFAAGRREFAAFAPETKEDYLYLRILSQTFDVTRAPHLRKRPFVAFPRIQLGADAMNQLTEYLAAA